MLVKIMTLTHYLVRRKVEFASKCFSCGVLSFVRSVLLGSL